MQRAIWIEFELRLSDGSLLESSTLSFIPGAGQILPALERCIRGLQPGQHARGVLKAEEAFGDSSLSPVSEIARGEFPAEAHLEPGRRFEAHTALGADVRFEILEVGEERVKVRFVHPLADQDVRYDVKVLAIDGLPPPLPAVAIGIDSEAICLEDSAAHAIH
jgi:FKBP-type peptidyl-prolyl cis-trans isomerase 2